MFNNKSTIDKSLNLLTGKADLFLGAVPLKKREIFFDNVFNNPIISE